MMTLAMMIAMGDVDVDDHDIDDDDDDYDVDDDDDVGDDDNVHQARLRGHHASQAPKIGY